MRKLFGTDGVRGIVNEWFTPERALRLGLAIGSYFGEGAEIVVGRDARAGNEFMVRAIVAGLISSGLRVYDAGLIPTPALQYNVRRRWFEGGVMITASHNPPEYVGVKVILSDGVEAPREVEAEIERTYWEERFRRVSWTSLGERVRRLDDAIEFYVDGIVSQVDDELIRQREWRVVVDAANNVGALTTPKVLRRLGAKVLTINSDISHIPYREPEPLPNTLVDTSKIVTAVGADFGVAHDGDADRAIFIDDRGRVMPGDRSAALLCKHIAETRPGLPRRVVTAVSSSTLIEEYLRSSGIEVVWTRVGSIVIARKMMEIGALAGFEENGGFMFPPHQYVRDGAMTTALMLEFLARERVRLSEAYDSLPKRFLIKDKLPLPGREVVPKILEAVKSMLEGARFIEVDGVKAIWDGNWVLVRPSGTEPVLRIFVESPTEKEAEELLRKIKSEIMKVLGAGQ